MVPAAGAPDFPSVETPIRAMVLESRAGSCAVMARAIGGAGGWPELVRKPDEVIAAWDHHEMLVVEAGKKDSNLQSLVKWARKTESDPYVVVVGDGEHDPGWLVGGRHGAHALMAQPDATAAALLLRDARAWLAKRPPGKIPQPSGKRRLGDESGARPANPPDWLPILIDRTTAAMAVFDQAMRYRMCNRAWRQLFGLLDAEVTGRSHHEVCPGTSEGWKEAYRRALEGEALKRDEDTLVDGSGAAVSVRWEIAPWRDASGAVGGVVAVFEPRRRRSGATEQFEAEIGRSILRATAGWMVVQDMNGIIIASSKGFSGAVGRSGRMFGRSYWEAAKVESSPLPAETFRSGMIRWKENGEFPFPECLTETLTGPLGDYEIAWSLFPYFPEGGPSLGLLRVGVPKLLSAPQTSDAVVVKAPAWDLPWLEDLPVLLWEADDSGMLSRVGEGLRRFAGVKGGDGLRHAEEFRRRITLTPSWFQKVNACLRGGLPVDEIMEVRTDEGPRQVRFVGTRSGQDVLRGWAMAMPERKETAAPADASRLAALEAEKATLKERLDKLMSALGQAQALAPTVEPPASRFNHLAEVLPIPIFVLDSAGHVMLANPAHRSLGASPAVVGASFEHWLLGAAGVSPDGIAKWRLFGWRKQTPFVLSLTDGSGALRRVEFHSRLDGDGHLMVVAVEIGGRSAPEAEASGGSPVACAPEDEGTRLAHDLLTHNGAADVPQLGRDLEVLAALCAGAGDSSDPALRQRLSIASLAFQHRVACRKPVMDATPLVREIVAMVEKERALLPQTISVSTEPLPLPPVYFMLLALAVRELLANALDHGKGPVSLGMGRLGETGWIEITDHGPGPMENASTPVVARRGLHLVELACSQMGGRLVSSRVPASSFRIVVPTAEVQIPVAQPAQEKPVIERVPTVLPPPRAKG